MATLTVYADAADGALECFHATYATARAGTGTLIAYGTDTLGLGNTLSGGAYYLDQSFLPFDTSALTAGAVVDSAVLSLYGKGKVGTGHGTIDACAYDFGATVTTADWLNGAALAALVPVASSDASGWTTSGYNAFSDAGAGLASAINRTGVTRLVALPRGLRLGSAPSAIADLTAHPANASGTSQDPMLVITYHMPSGRPRRTHLGRRPGISVSRAGEPIRL